ncbi:MAG: hypothetical protein GXP08_14945 [Gammaproteobacteria bacterium]|nr:hypothetical protein [Gammaproteobacteria bacterium]
MKTKYLLAILWLGLALSACSKPEEKSQAHFLSSQQQALEKAKDVDNVIAEADRKTRQQIEDSFK